LATITKNALVSFFEASEHQSERIVRRLLDVAGVRVNGPARHDIQVHDRRIYTRWLRDGNLGMGESYMDGWWDCEAIDELVERMLLANVRAHLKSEWSMVAHVLKAKLLNLQNVRRARQSVERIYDVGADVYEAMLDERMLYTCGYWKDTDDLDAAQLAKIDLACAKLGLKEGMRVLELGCGWGGFAQRAASHYGVHVTGVSVSRAQLEYAERVCAGLDVDLRFQDYREVTGRFDAVLSMGMMEHIGFKNYRSYMEVVRRCLRPGGVSLLHTIAGNERRNLIDPWIHRYIFPNALLPTMGQIGEAMEGLLVVEDLHNFGPHYDRTLMAWNSKFEAAWDELAGRYDERFRRMWRYYLLISAAGFRARDMQLFQIVMTPTGTPPPDCRKS
jgi:cyclopropane-fatty-acyl-phospholipid synthase